jgi:hypothetical protein
MPSSLIIMPLWQTVGPCAMDHTDLKRREEGGKRKDVVQELGTRI